MFALQHSQNMKWSIESPGFLNHWNFFGYIYFFPSFLCGPPIEFADYLKWADYSLFPKQKIPHTIIPAIQQMLLSFLILVPVFLSLQYPPSLLFTDEFAALPFFVRQTLTFLILMIFRAKYYMLWWLAEAGYIACGFAYNSEKDGVIDWTRTKNVYPISCEFGDNVQTKTRGWNIKVSDWLKYYVYMRLMPEGPRGVPFYVTLATYGVSAMWHGFYPGYYLFFLTFAILDQLARLIRSRIRPYFLPEGSLKKRVYDVLCFFCMNFVTNYLGLSFVVLDLGKVLDWWKAQYYYGHIAVFSLYAILFVWSSIAPLPTKSRSE